MSVQPTLIAVMSMQPVVTLVDLTLAYVKMDILEMGELAVVRCFPFDFGFVVVVVVDDLQWYVRFCRSSAE